MSKPNQAPGVPLSHRFMPTETDRVIKEAEGEKPTLASEIGFNPVTTLKIGNEKVFVRAVNNTQSRYLKPVALNGAVVLPIRGERVFEFSDDLKTQLSTKVATLAKPLTEPEGAESFLGVAAPAIKPRPASSAGQTTKLLSDLAATTAAVRNFLKQSPSKATAVIERPNFQPSAPPAPVPAAPTPTSAPAVVAPAIVSAPVPAPKQPVPTAAAPTAATEIPQANTHLVEARQSLEERRADLQDLQRRQDSLLSQILNTSEAGNRDELLSKVEVLEKSHGELTTELGKLKSEAAGFVSTTNALSDPEIQRQTAEWTVKLDQVLSKQQIILDYLQAKEDRIKKQIEPKKAAPKSEKPQAIPETTKVETPMDTLATLPALASKLIETTVKPKVFISYKPINLPTVPVRVEPVAAEPSAQPPPYQSSTPGAIPARLEVVETTKSAPTVAPAVSLPVITPALDQERIADVVSKQLESERQRFENEIKEQLEKETQVKLEEQKKALEVVQAKIDEQSNTLRPRSDSVIALAPEKTDLKEPAAVETTKAPEAAKIEDVIKQMQHNEPELVPPPVEAKEAETKVENASFNKEEAQREIDQQTIHKELVQAEGKVNHLGLESLSAGEREQLMGRLRSLAQQSEVLRQYDDLQYQREKQRINDEIKEILEVAEKKFKSAEDREKEEAEEQKQTEAARKAKVAKEVKELVEREKAKKARTHNVVQAQPAYGKMIPPKVAFPNVINGIVRDSKGMLLSGVVMIIKDQGGEPVRALKSNKIGQFVISTPLPNGIYNIELEKEDTEFDIVQVEAKGQIMNPIEIRSL